MTSLAIFSALLPTAQCKAKKSSKYSDTRTIILAQGEQKSLPVEKILKFSVGNSKIIGHKFQKKQSKLLIKGKKIGYTDLILWNSGKKVTKYHIYVLSRSKQMDHAELVSIFKKLSLNPELIGTNLVIQGIINNFKDYQLLIKTYISNRKSLILDINLGQKLKRLLIAKIYEQFYEQDIEDIFCTVHSNNIEINCHYHAYKQLKKTEQKLSQSILVNFEHQKYGQKSNFQVSYKFFLAEKQNSVINQSELYQLGNKIEKMIRGNFFNIKGKSYAHYLGNIQLKFLANPVIVTSLGKENTISIGQEFPIKSTNSEGDERIEWKFVGINLKFNFNFFHKHLRYIYDFKFSRPLGEQIADQSSSSSVLLNLNRTKKLFHFSINSNIKEQKSVPYLGKIPILGNLFSDKTNTQTQQTILCYLEIKELKL